MAGKWLIIVDGSELDEGTMQKNVNYLSCRYNKGKENEFVRYHRSVLEAKIYFGNDLVASIATEPIEKSLPVGTDIRFYKTVVRIFFS